MMQRKLKLICVMLFAALIIFTGCSETSVDGETYSAYESYREIPGITDEEIAKIEELKNKYAEFSIGVNYSTEAFADEAGQIGGFSVLFAQWMSDLFDIPFEVNICDWDDLISGLTSHEIDFSIELTATPERQDIYYMTDPVAERLLKSFRLSDSVKLSEIAAERDLNYAFLNGSTSYDFLKESSEFSFKEFFVEDYPQAIDLLENGEIDAFFDEGTAEAAFHDYPGIKAEEYYPLIYTPTSLITANPELAAVIDIVDKYIDNGAVYHLTSLYNDGHQEYLKYKLYMQLAESEKSYLKYRITQGKTIPIAAEYDNYPLSFYNQQEKEWQGIAIDVLSEIEKLTDLEFEVINQPTDQWPMLLDMLDNGQTAIVTELIPSPERKGLYLWPDVPYTTDSYALISRAEKESIKVNQVLYAKVAVAEDTAFEEIFRQWFPHHKNIVVYPSTDACFLALEEGEVDFVMASRNLMLSVTNYFEKPGFKTNVLFNHTYESSFGLNKKETELCSIISKAQSVIDTTAITENWTHKVFDYRSKVLRSQIPYLVGLVLLLVIVLGLVLFLLYKNRRSSIELENLVKQRTEELEIQTEAAKVASQTKSEFLSRMSHEIRTPLNAIMGMAQVARQIPDQSDKSKNAIMEILTASDHLMGILNDVLDMSKIESGKFILSKESFSLKAAMSEVSNIITHRCTENKVTFYSNLEELSELYVSGDKLRLKQVLINLLGNAVKFTNVRGSVNFIVNVEAETNEDVTLSFSIEDTGIGMSEEQIKSLFTAFEQTDSSIAAHYGGTGLGLAISQNLVKQMGGEISVMSAKDIGSTFFFTLKLEKTDHAKIAAQFPSDHAKLDLSDKHILLVEDVEINRLIILELLSDTGVLIEEAEDGLKAIDIIEKSEENKYDLIFMDIQMPGIDGYETAKRIRSLDRADAKLVPILAMTANAYKEDIDKAMESGMNGHISKPIDIDKIREALRELLL